MKVAIIGAGASGLCSAKYCLANHFQITIYEQCNSLGGTWIYLKEVGKDANGLDIHTSMYKSLKTNSAKEITIFPDFPMNVEEKASFIPGRYILEYLKCYASNFKIVDHIKFDHHVVRVRPIFDNQWEIIVKDLDKNDITTEIYDAVMVCSGHFNAPNIPHIEGKNEFLGHQMHSHDFRTNDRYKDAEVLLIGSGPSGMDIANEISKIAKKVFLSHHKEMDPHFAVNVILKPDVRRLTTTGAEFEDGTQENFTEIVYCTGYHYSYPFLSMDCGLTVDENCVEHLYKQIINIKKPTMAVIGVNIFYPCFQVFDMQVRFFIEFLSGRKQLPTLNEMKNDIEKEIKRRQAKGIPKKLTHMLGNDQLLYYTDLSKTADIQSIKPVVAKVHLKNIHDIYHDIQNYTKNCYKLIDDETFECTMLDSE